VRFLGNPVLDLVAAAEQGHQIEEGASAGGQGRQQCLALLPGSRHPEASRNLILMLRMLPHLPEGLQDPERLRLQAALVGDLPAEAVASLAAPLGWRIEPGTLPEEEGTPRVLARGRLRLQLHWGRFATVLRGSDLVLSMTGTAAEQAVGLGLPVLQLVGGGPQFTAGFAEAQRRLLGPGVVCADGPAGNDTTLAASASLAAALLERQAATAADAHWREELRRLAEERIGPPGGSARLAAAIMDIARNAAR
jgi:uncharacterized protein (TIGR03492 family)